MRSNNLILLLAVAAFLAVAGCGGSSGSGPAAPSLVSIAVTPSSASISIGATQQYTATGMYTDGVTTRDLTATVTWSSSAPEVAGITVGGLASASTTTPGTTMITARSGNVTGSAILTVTGGTTTTTVNVMPLTVNGSLCSAATSAGYLNKPCVSVTICMPGTNTCQTIKDIILDTGSYGLRIFSQALTISLPTVSSGGGALTECAQFADGSADWGPVKTADVVLGSEPAITVPIQVIDANFGAVPSSCGTPDAGPSDAGFNGILGVGLFAQDCGGYCVHYSTNSPYYSCSGTVCSGTTVPLTAQVSNPVISLPTDSNGVIVQLPSVPTSGSQSVDGTLVLGIGTRSNNSPTGLTAYVADPNYGEINTVFNGTLYGSIVDSGSNGLFFPQPSSGQLPLCSFSVGASWYCPSSLVTLSATNQGYQGSPSVAAFFSIGNFGQLVNSSNMVFSNIGGNTSGMFDWGLPFYFGRRIAVGIEQTTSGLGTGPYVAF